MAVLAPTPRAMVSAAVSAKTGLFRSVRPANARSRNDILPPHSLAAVALGMLPPLFPLAFEFFLRRLCRDMAMAMWRKRVLVAARQPGPKPPRTPQSLLLFKNRASARYQSPHTGVC